MSKKPETLADAIEPLRREAEALREEILDAAGDNRFFLWLFRLFGIRRRP